MTKAIPDKTIEHVYNKIGRNVVLYQQLELLLKNITSKNVLGYESELKQKVALVGTRTKAKTLGQLVGEYPLKVETKDEIESRIPDGTNEAYLSISFATVSDEAFVSNKKEELAKLVNDRNNLIHHLLLKYDLTSIKDCLKLQCVLDEQAVEIRRSIQHALHLNKTITEMANFLQSEEFIEIFDRKDPILLAMAEIASKPSRDDGWTLLSTAAHILQQKVPALAELKQTNNFKSLKSYMNKSSLFIFGEESTPKGGTRSLYKLKKHINFS